MRFDEGHAFSSETISREADASSGEELPLEISFLHPGEVDRGVLTAVAKAARLARVSAASVLIAEGHVSASRYYRALARHLDLDFIDDWPEISADTDIASAFLLGRIGLAVSSPVRWLVAPRDDALRRLLSADRTGPRGSAMAITTPSHLAALIHYRSQHAIEWAASDALPEKNPRLSARGALDWSTCSAAVLASIILVAAIILEPRFVGFSVGLLFLLGIIFRMAVTLVGLETSSDPPRRLADVDLPTYTVLVPLRDEGDILPDCLAALERLDYPRAKLEVLVLIEPEDLQTRRALAHARLPPWLHVVFGPWGGRLRTKPRALNIGLLMARGRLLTVFDAEDRPDPNQLRLAAAMFAQLPESVACLQARLAIDNGSGSLLARLFALEYAFLFDVFNVGIGGLRLPMALGGTSNHFKTAVLRDAGGWDAWNVTEDADLGLRLARLGFGVVCLPSTTLEVAPDRIGAWIKQRRRWLKGWMQTLLVLAKDVRHLARDLGPFRLAALISLLVNLVVGPLVFPFFSAYVAYNLVRHGIPSPSSFLEIGEATIGTIVVALGLVSSLGCGYAGLRARKLEAFLPSLFLVLPYQLLISLAAWAAAGDLILRPYHWHKTDHAARRRETGPEA